MTVNVLFAAGDDDWPDYEGPLTEALEEAGVAAHLSRDVAPEDADWIVHAPSGPIRDFGPYSRARGVLGLWAGVEGIVGNTTLTQPLTRMVDPGLTEGMVEWVTGHVLRHHLGLDAQIAGQDGVWRPQAPPLARDRRVAVLGLGALGSACARTLAGLNFRVAGWSGRPKDIAGVTCRHGADGLAATLAEAEILVLLLPLTSETENLIDAAALARMPAEAVLLNPGRGGLIDDLALLAALDTGQLSHATLDVFRTEPLPPAHPFWAHPKVTVTPHIASATRPATAARVIADNIRRGEAGLPLLHLVDRTRGY
jgi:glyoxylate/hydroxypyruvate reductase A